MYFFTIIIIIIVVICYLLLTVGCSSVVRILQQVYLLLHISIQWSVPRRPPGILRSWQFHVNFCMAIFSKSILFTPTLRSSSFPPSIWVGPYLSTSRSPNHTWPSWSWACRVLEAYLVVKTTLPLYLCSHRPHESLFILRKPSIWNQTHSFVRALS